MKILSSSEISIVSGGADDEKSLAYWVVAGSYCLALFVFIEVMRRAH